MTSARNLVPATFIRVIEDGVPSEDSGVTGCGGGLFGSPEGDIAAVMALYF